MNAQLHYSEVFSAMKSKIENISFLLHTTTIDDFISINIGDVNRPRIVTIFLDEDKFLRKVEGLVAESGYFVEGGMITDLHYTDALERCSAFATLSFQDMCEIEKQLEGKEEEKEVYRSVAKLTGRDGSTIHKFSTVNLDTREEAEQFRWHNLPVGIGEGEILTVSIEAHKKVMSKAMLNWKKLLWEQGI